MCKFFYLISFLFLLACSEKDHLSISGTVPGTEYDGEFIYLVPFTGATLENIDSTTIEQGRFRFEKNTARQNEMAILRTRPLLRLTLQELLVVIEPGELEVSLDKESKASGTTLNESLQEWKEKKTQTDEARILLKQMWQVADDRSKEELQTQLDRLKEDAAIYNYAFVQKNKDNIVGQFVYSMIESGLTEQQKNLLNINQ